MGYIKLVIKIQYHMFKKNKKTTIAGVFAAIGQVLSASPNHTFSTIGQIVSGIAILLLGKAATDAQ